MAQQLAAMEHACGEALHAELHATADPQQLKAQEQHLRNCLSEQSERLLQTRQKVEILRVQAERVEELREELVRWQQKQEKGRENVRILDDTMDFLQQAKENLSTSYLGSIRTRFGYYLSQLEDSAGESYFVDADFQVQLERMGQARELAYFSAGQADLIMLCMRLALVDALFKGQETLVILDDPFVNLDDVHTAQAQRLLRKLSRERQILYLTCHSSRTLTSKS
jgi:DNA repair exonuclease SbcCD ATPase subunit